MGSFLQARLDQGVCGMSLTLNSEPLGGNVSRSSFSFRENTFFEETST